MNEATKTFVFVGAALLSVVLAIATRPTSGEYDPSDQLGKDLAKQFDPEEAKRLTIAKFDEATATSEAFEVAELDGVWTLPSKGGYPADAQRKLAEAITGVTDRQILQIASQDPNEHAEFGVIDPTSPKLEPGQTGVGSRVSLSKEDGEKLVDVIIGKEVKDADDQRYVRRGGQDVVYVVEIDPNSFSTDFAEWIEDDLLKISPFDIERVQINDYSSELFLTLQGLAADNTYRSKMTLRYDDDESDWRLEQLQVPDDPKQPDYETVELDESQELNDDSLRELKNSLDDLRIVDVSRKPEGLSASLKAGEEFLKDQSSLQSLVQRGFAPTRNDAGELDLLSSEGEVIVTMKDGVEYVLRFGNLELADDASEQPKQENPDGEQGAEGGEGVNRYLFVMAQFNEAAVESPELEIVPELPEGAKEPEVSEEAVDEKTDADATTDSADGDAETTDAEATDAEGDEGAASEDGDSEADDPPSELEEAVAERQAVEERNARALDEYADKLEAGRQRVSQLNARFGDWYYVVSNEVFNKIRLSREDVIKEKEPAEGEEADEPADGSSAFGAPGAAVPGLPGLGAALGGTSSGESEETESQTEDNTSEESADNGEPADAEPSDEESADE